MRGVQPVRGARIPRESAREVSDLIDVAFHVREDKPPLGFRDTFFAGQAGLTKSQDASFDRLRALPPIHFSKLEKPNVPLAVIQIPSER